MNERIRSIFNRVGTDSSGKWMSVHNAEDFASAILELAIDEGDSVHHSVEEHSEEWHRGVDAAVNAIRTLLETKS